MDGVFKALADPTRRSLLDRLRTRDGQTLTELEESTDMTRFGVMKHLKILEDASLVVSRRSGRFKHHYLNAVPLQEVIDRWIEPLTTKPLARYALDLKAAIEGENSMPQEKPDFVLETYIRASIDDVWDALTNPDKFEKYHFFHARPAGDWAIGSRIDYVLPTGHPMLGGEILAYEPKTRIEMGFEPNWAPDLKPSRMAYELAQMGDACRLTILHWDIPEGQDGVASGWSQLAASLKSWIETGAPLIIPPKTDEA
ncbi:MAG: metalloregulator ArsR/SmtB family transcription factor [Pseudomonadota bacterium]